MRRWIKDHIFTSVGIAVCLCLVVLVNVTSGFTLDDHGYDYDPVDRYGYGEYDYADDGTIDGFDHEITPEDIENGIWSMSDTANSAVHRYNELYPDDAISPHQVSSSRMGGDWVGSVIDGTIVVTFDSIGDDDYITITSDMNYNANDTGIFQDGTLRWVTAILGIDESDAELVMKPLFKGMAREIDPGREWYTSYKDLSIYYEVKGYSHTYQVTIF